MYTFPDSSPRVRPQRFIEIGDRGAPRIAGPGRPRQHVPANISPALIQPSKLVGKDMYSKANGMSFGLRDSDLDRTATQKMMSRLQPFFNFIYLFAQTSSIHGLNHLTNRKRHIIEKLVWGVFLGLGLYGALAISSTTWKHYQENPTVISMERDYKEWNTSFPSVTICPTTKYDEGRVTAVAERLGIGDHDRLQMFLMKLANATYDNFLEVPDDFPQILPSQYMDLILDVKLDFYYTVSGSNAEANNIGQLQETITEHGLCYAFNSDIAIYNSPSYFRSKNRTMIERGWSFYGSPLDGDVFAQVMDMNSGYLVYIHSPNETADFSSQRLESPAGSYKTLDISALSIYSSQQAGDLKVEQRRCRFLAESNLTISPVYSYNLCRNECRMKLAYDRCQCVPHFYRPVHNLKICDVKGLHCLAKYRELLSTLREPETNKKIECNCVAPCNDVNYVIENDHTMPWFLGTNLKWGMTKYPRMRLKRDVLFGFIDVLVSVGGTVGLFLGCSVLSLMEIVYFFTLKAYWYVMEQRAAEKREIRKQEQDIQNTINNKNYHSRLNSDVYLH